MKKSKPKYQPGGSTSKAKVKKPVTKKVYDKDPFKIEPVMGLPDWKSTIAKMLGKRQLEKAIRENRRIMMKHGGSTYSPGDMGNYTTSSKGNVAPGMQTTFDSIPENNMYGGEKRKKKK
tara:strand:- start:718 stop:1074 length:357 start_codon:yes stop_codon:yes gene_type:complete